MGFPYLQILPLFVEDNDLVPLVRLQPHGLEGVLLDELHPAVLVTHPGEERLGKKQILHCNAYSLEGCVPRTLSNMSY